MTKIKKSRHPMRARLYRTVTTQKRGSAVQERVLSLEIIHFTDHHLNGNTTLVICTLCT